MTYPVIFEEGGQPVAEFTDLFDYFCHHIETLYLPIAFTIVYNLNSPLDGCPVSRIHLIRDRTGTSPTDYRGLLFSPKCPSPPLSSVLKYVVLIPKRQILPDAARVSIVGNRFLTWMEMSLRTSACVSTIYRTSVLFSDLVSPSCPRI